MKVYQNSETKTLHQDQEDALFHAKMNVTGSTTRFTTIKVENIGSDLFHVTGLDKNGNFRANWVEVRRVF